MNAWKKNMTQKFGTLTKENIANLWAMLKDSNRLSAKDELADRARTKKLLDECTENGLIAKVTSGMDCDCSKYRRVYHVPTPTVMAWVQYCEGEYHYADGPMSIWIARPSLEPEGSESRDLALEAFEDGHAHIVYA